jgi:hypothetical protein
MSSHEQQGPDMRRATIIGPQFLSLDVPGRSGQPPVWRWVVGTVVAIGLSLAACAGLVAVATHVFPSTVGYVHFQSVTTAG